MKLKDLIKELQDIDEEYGKEEELHVCVGNIDVESVIIEPSYWDGSQQIVVRDEKGRPIKGIYKRTGNKVVINTWSFKDLIWDRENFEIDYSELGEERTRFYKESHNKIVQQRQKLDYELELEYFIEHMVKRSRELIEDTGGSDGGNIKAVAEKFFNESLSYEDPVPEDLKDYCKYSYRDQRDHQWERELELSFDGYGFKITKRS